MRPRVRHAARAARHAHRQEAEPLPPRRQVPGREARLPDDLGGGGEEDGRPARAAADGVRDPGVAEGEDDADDGGEGGVDVDGGDGVALGFEPEFCRGVSSVRGW